MSYDLNFWKYKKGVCLDHQLVYESLCDGLLVDGLEELPIEKMLARLEQLFADGWHRQSKYDWESQTQTRGAFQIYANSQLFRINCYGMEGEDMNRFIDLGEEFGCPLYDPQAGRRFDGHG